MSQRRLLPLVFITSLRHATWHAWRTCGTTIVYSIFLSFFGYKMLFSIKPLKAVDFGRWGGTVNDEVIHCFIDFTRHKLTNEIIVWHESWQLLNHYRINLLCRIPFEINQSCFRHARIDTLIGYVKESFCISQEIPLYFVLHLFLTIKLRG